MHIYESLSIHLWRRFCSWTTTRQKKASYSVCMLALVSSKAHSTDRGLRVDTRLHSICRFSLEGGQQGHQHWQCVTMCAEWEGDRNTTSRPTVPSMWQIKQLCISQNSKWVLCRHTKQCVPVSVVFFESWEGRQWIIQLWEEEAELAEEAFIRNFKQSFPF